MAVFEKEESDFVAITVGKEIVLNIAVLYFEIVGQFNGFFGEIERWVRIRLVDICCISFVGVNAFIEIEL
jgi:hypothetical protein